LYTKEDNIKALSSSTTLPCGGWEYELALLVLVGSSSLLMVSLVVLYSSYGLIQRIFSLLIANIWVYYYCFLILERNLKMGMLSASDLLVGMFYI
jgi:hypothetical protein